MLKTMLVAAVAMSAISTCSSPRDEAEPTPDASTQSPSATTTTPPSTVAPEPVNSSEHPPRDPSRFDLMYVRTTAPDCGSVWLAGGRLPGNYQWCSSEGEPVSGVRIGPCEVIVFKNQFYAIPGRQITAVNGEITQDPAFNRARTSCKRKPAPVRGR